MSMGARRRAARQPTLRHDRGSANRRRKPMRRPRRKPRRNESRHRIPLVAKNAGNGVISRSSYDGLMLGHDQRALGEVEHLPRLDALHRRGRQRPLAMPAMRRLMAHDPAGIGHLPERAARVAFLAAASARSDTISARSAEISSSTSGPRIIPALPHAGQPAVSKNPPAKPLSANPRQNRLTLLGSHARLAFSLLRRSSSEQSLLERPHPEHNTNNMANLRRENLGRARSAHPASHRRRPPCPRFALSRATAGPRPPRRRAPTRPRVRRRRARTRP